ncbi:transmembrane channel-like protein 7 isoform X1 [Ornithodoros turicata]|uniref:transmembrane channel-like protein 7 isoform X1 n=1 Tax=Ornithodoros turicata TaxID=34597 RepID=UPI003138DAEC
MIRRSGNGAAYVNPCYDGEKYDSEDVGHGEPGGRVTPEADYGSEDEGDNSAVRYENLDDARRSCESERFRAGASTLYEDLCPSENVRSNPCCLQKPWDPESTRQVDSVLQNAQLCAGDRGCDDQYLELQGERTAVASGDVGSHEREQREHHTMKEAVEVAQELGWIDETIDCASVDGADGRIVRRDSSAVKRSLADRNRLQKAPYHHGEKFDMWDFKSLKAMRKASEIWKDVSSFLTMWSNSLKQIEGHYGTGVASYFLFLRWLLFLNLLMFFLPLLLIIIPHFVFPKTSTSLPLSHLLVPSPFTVLPINATTGYSTSSPAPFAAAFTAEEMSNRTSQLAEECYTMYRVRVTEATGGGISYLQDFLQGTGWMELTALFAGRYYEAVESLPSTRLPYNFPLAYILANICCFLLCLLMMIRYTTVGVRETLLVSEGKLHQYCNLVFASWDFCITDERTARLKRISIIQELKSYLAEERRDAELAQWSRSKKITLLVVRFFTNLVVLIIIAASLYAVYVATSASFGEQASSDGSSKDGFWALVVQFIPSLVITGLNIVIPGVFSHLIRFENYSTAFEIKLTLLRTVFLRFTSIFVLLISLYKQINCEKGEQGVCFEGKDDVCKKPVCWETAVGQQIYKLTLLDFVVGVALVFLIELPRRLLVTRVDSKLTKWIGRPEFSIPTRVLDLVYSQTLCWLGTFYCPILPAISILKYFIIFYVQKYTLMNNSGPLQTSYRASRSNTFFMIVLMLALFLVIVPFGYALVEIPPSVACGPFRHFGSTWDVVKDTVRRWGWPLQNIVSFLTSMACALPTVFILVICIYSYLSVSAAHRHMEKVLKDKLVLEGKDKQFLLARITEVARQQAASNR